MFYLAGVLAAAVLGAGLTWTTDPGSGEGGGVLHLAVTLEEEDLLLVTEGGEEQADYEILATLEDVAYARETGTLRREDLPRTVTLDISDVPAGRHDLAVVIVDRETGRSRTIQREVFVPGASRSCWTADDLYLESGFQLRPSQPLELRWAVFPPTEGDCQADSLRSAYVIRDDGGEVVAEGWMTPAGEESGEFRAFDAEIDMSGAEPGEYQVIAAAILEEEPVAAVRADMEVLPDWDVWGRDLERTRMNIRPIALQSELNRLEEAGSRSQREAVMSRFWMRRDPNPDSERNEYLEEYLRRLDYVESRFRVFSLHGAATDMGRVYLLLGEPDMREDHPIETGGRPYQVWTYFTPAITVVFVDDTGYGSYQLSTPWEEIRDSVELPVSSSSGGGWTPCAA